MRKNILIILLLSSLVSCTGLSNKETRPLSAYPYKIDSLNMRKQYDEAKWVIYCFNCDDTCKFFKETAINDTLTFGMLDLKFEGLRNHSDTLNLEFNFYYHDTIRCDERVCRTRSLTGLAYQVDKEEYFAIIDTRWGNYFWKPTDTRSRLYNPLQPEVIAYINANKERINPWFYKEAKKRGVLK